MRIVAALGGNALLRPGEPLEAAAQRRNAERAATALAPLAARHQLVVTHGNGPQVGLLAMESGMGGGAGPYPLDVLGAESQGMIGYLLGTALRNAIPRAHVVTILTDVEVDPADTAFSAPAKPVGPVLRSDADIAAARSRGWRLAADRGAMRRVVASPVPLRVLDGEAVARLLEASFLVVAAGGGGVPVVRRGDVFEGVEAVVDKDHTSALLAADLHADWLLLLTDVTGVYEDGPGRGEPLPFATPDMLRKMALPAGSMGPKAEAACRFVDATGGNAAIGAIGDAADIIEGRAGTRVVLAMP